MFGLKRYNYDTFTKDLLVKDIARTRFTRGPQPGEPAPDFEGRTLDGDEIRLRDYAGRQNVALTFGSATCPFTAGSIRGLNRLYGDFRYKDVQFLFVYVREAHPGERLPAHRTIQEKARAAELFRAAEHVELPVIVDDLKGSIHRQYGKLPNASFLIDKSGRIAFRCLWTRAGVLREALEDLLAVQEERGAEHAIVRGGDDTAMPMTYAMLHTHRALDRGGRKALADFHRELGLAGRLSTVTSRVAGPVAMHPGKALAGAALAGGVIAGGLFLGRALRHRRYARYRQPYRVPAPPRTATGDYEAVGI
jgi:peroxiredoxin